MVLPNLIVVGCTCWWSVQMTGEAGPGPVDQKFGLVPEIRALDLSSGRLLLEFDDVASGIQIPGMPRH